MALSEAQCGRLFDALEKIGWHRREDFVYAPHETMWLMVSQPWTGDLQDFHDRMVGRLHRIGGMQTFQRSQVDHQKAIDDVAGLVQVLQDMISDESDDS
jgi:hypothetical protein